VFLESKLEKRTAGHIFKALCITTAPVFLHVFCYT